MSDSFFKSEVSYAEQNIAGEIRNMQTLVKENSVTVEDAEILIQAADRCKEKCTELRHSRDALHKTINKLKRKLEEKT